MRYMGIGKQRIMRTKRRFHGLDERTLKIGFWTETVYSGVFF